MITIFGGIGTVISLDDIGMNNYMSAALKKFVLTLKSD